MDGQLSWRHCWVVGAQSRRLLGVIGLHCCLGCGAPAPRPADGDAGTAAVEIGVPGGPDGLDFTPLTPGGELRLQSFGQGGTHVFLGVRCIGFGNRAFVSITLTNLLTLAQSVSPAPVRPQLLFCGTPTECDLVPILAMAGALSEPGAERNGLAIEVSVEVRNQAGLEARATEQAVLSTADL
jgi:hypothetical protein